MRQYAVVCGDMRYARKLVLQIMGERQGCDESGRDLTCCVVEERGERRSSCVGVGSALFMSFGFFPV